MIHANVRSTANRLGTVLVTEIRAQVRKSAPLSGALVWAGAQGGTDLIDLGIDLDEADPVVRTRTDDRRLGEPYADRHAITIEPDEIVPLDIVAQTAKHYCEWCLEFTVQVDGIDQTEVVGAGKEPFRTTAYAENYEMVLSDGPALSGGLALS